MNLFQTTRALHHSFVAVSSCRRFSAKSTTVTFWHLMFSSNDIWRTWFVNDNWFWFQGHLTCIVFFVLDHCPLCFSMWSSSRILGFHAFFPWSERAALSSTVVTWLGLPPLVWRLRMLGAENCLASPSTLTKRLGLLPLVGLLCGLGIGSCLALSSTVAKRLSLLPHVPGWEWDPPQDDEWLKQPGNSSGNHAAKQNHDHKQTQTKPLTPSTLLHCSSAVAIKNETDNNNADCFIRLSVSFLGLKKKWSQDGQKQLFQTNSQLLNELHFCERSQEEDCIGKKEATQNCWFCEIIFNPAMLAVEMPLGPHGT